MYFSRILKYGYALIAMSLCLEAAAQNHQGFESYSTGITTLYADCWSTGAFTVQADPSMEGSKSLRSGTVNNPASPSTARSPWIYFDGTGSLIFKHRTSGLSSSPKLNVTLENRQTSVSTNILSYTYTSTSIVTTTLPITVSGTYRIIFTASGNGGASRVFIDDIFYPGVDLGNRANNPGNAGVCGCVAPVVGGVEVTSLPYNQGQAATVITQSITVTEPVVINIQQATVKISNNYIIGGEDELTFTNMLGISGAWDGSTGTLTLTGPASLADYQTALRSIKYQNNNNVNPSSLNRTVSYVVNDGNSDSNTVTRNITINPYYNLVGSTTEISTQCFTVTPALSNQAGAVWRKTPLSLQNSFELNLDARFSASSVVNDAGADGITFVLQRDFTSGSPINAIGVSGGAQGYAGITPSIGVTFDTYDNGAPEPSYDNVSIAKNGNTTSFLTTSVAAKLDVSNNPLNIEDGIYHTIKIAWGKSTNTLDIYFDGALRLTYSEDFINTVFGGDPNNIYWGFTSSTGGQNNEQSVCGVAMNIYNAPVGANASVSTNEDVNYTYAPSDFTFSDADGHAFSGIQIVSVETAGDLEYAGADVVAGTLVTTIPQLVFKPSPDATGSPYASFTFKVKDSSGDLSAATYTMTMDVINMTPDCSAMTAPADATSNISASTGTTLTWAAPVTGPTPSGYKLYLGTNPAATNLVNGTDLGTVLLYATGVLSCNTTYYWKIVPTNSGNDAVGCTIYSFDTNTAGDPTVFGNNSWNVYAFADNIYSDYKGYYTESSLIFDSQSKWDMSSSPSMATGYQGCTVPDDGHSVSYKRQGFTSNYYQIDIPWSDDNASLFIDGVLVNNYACCGSYTNAWTGYLDATSKVEFRWSEITINSRGAVNFTVVTPVVLTAGGIDGDQTICPSSDPAAFTSTSSYGGGCYFTGYQWQSSTDNAIFSDIPGATTLTYDAPSLIQTTYFRRAALDACNQVAYTASVKVTVNSAPTDITLLGNNIDELQPIGTTIGSLSTEDSFVGDIFTYSLEAGSDIGFEILGDQLKSTLSLPAGDYSISVKVTDACALSFSKVFAITVNATNSSPIAVNDGPFTLSGSLPFSIDVLANDIDPDGDILSIVSVTQPTFGTVTIDGNKIIYQPTGIESELVTFNYTIQDPDSLTNEAMITINYTYTSETVTPISSFKISEGFSPNNDGINESWYIKGIEEYGNNSISVFNRWGILVYHAKGYDNTNVLWDGRANTGQQSGHELDQGTYYYTLNLGNKTATLTGYIEIVR